MTNRNLICCTESLQQTKQLFVALSHCKKTNLYMLQKNPKVSTRLNFLALLTSFGHFSGLFFPLFCIIWGHFLLFFWNFLVTYNIFLFCFSDKKNFCLLQWLSSINQNSVCRRDSVRQTIEKIYPISLLHVTKKLEKRQKQISIQIWISPAL